MLLFYIMLFLCFIILCYIVIFMLYCYVLSSWPHSSVCIATGYGLDGPGIESRWGTIFSAPVQTGHRAHPSSCTMGTGSSPGVKSGRCVTLTPHPFLVLWSCMSRAIPLLCLWAVRSVQSLSACTKVHFNFTNLSADICTHKTCLRELIQAPHSHIHQKLIFSHAAAEIHHKVAGW